MITVSQALRGVSNRLARSRYHASHRDEALRALRNIEASTEPLSADLRSTCDAYAQEVLGSRRYAPWLYVYTAMAGEFREGWIPDNFYGEVVVPQVGGAYGGVSGLKPLNGMVFGSEAFPDLASYVNGAFLDRDYRWIPTDEVARHLFRDHDRVVFKPSGSGQGRGIRFLDRDGFDVHEAMSFGNGLYQAMIDQHDALASLHASSVATVRATTVYEEGGTVSLRACYLRLGTGRETHVRPATTVRVAIDPSTGRFDDRGYTADWVALDRHPTSGEAFAGRTVPAFSACRQLVTELHGRYPFVRCLGWDLAVDRHETPQVMEWNGKHNDIKFGEATQGPCFLDLGWSRLRRTG